MSIWIIDVCRGHGWVYRKRTEANSVMSQAHWKLLKSICAGELALFLPWEASPLCCTKTSITTNLIELLACHGVSRLCEVPSPCAGYNFWADLPSWRCLPISAFCSLHFWTWLCSLYQINLSSITNINWVRCTQVLQGPKGLPRQAETTVATSKRGGGDLHQVRSISLWLVLALRSGEPQPWQKVCRGVENVLWELAVPGLFSVFWYYCFRLPVCFSLFLFWKFRLLVWTQFSLLV